MKKSIFLVADVNPIKTGEHLKNLRISHHYSVEEIALFAGISNKSVYAWENGTNVPSLSNLIGLRSLYDLNRIDDLLICS